MLRYLKSRKYAINKFRIVQTGRLKSKFEKDKKMCSPIDFVVTWVDGSDPEWIAQKNFYETQYGITNNHTDNGDERYRDWELLRYWFRAVEKYAPWVNNVYFVTCGQMPEWLNCNAPKLKIVNHSDYIPAQYLPTFNTNPIELNFHRIKDISEYIVNFNDDMFIAKPVKPEDFFKDDLPNYTAIARPLKNGFYNGAFEHMQFSVLGILNGHFKNISVIIKKHREKWFAHQYGDLIKVNERAFDDNYIYGMYFPHLAVPFRKSTLEKVWRDVHDVMEETSTHRFRTPKDMIHQIVSLWDIMDGNFNPVNGEHWGKVFNMPWAQRDEICDAIKNQKYRTICINDSEQVTYEEYIKLKSLLIEAMTETFPTKSSFEL